MIGATLFSGIGAPECAMPHWHWPWHAEIERFPSAVMAERHPQSQNLGDVTAHDFAERAEATARPDILVFGSPCQDFSVAGKRLGLDGARGNLALTALRIVAQLKPRWFVFENVPGLLSNWSGAPECPPDAGSSIEGVENGDFAAFVGTVDELRYSGAWASLDAQFFGVAQRRERLFFVGHSGDWRYPAAVLLEPESLCGHSAPRRETGKDVAPTIAGHPSGGGGLGTDFDCDGGLVIPLKEPTSKGDAGALRNSECGAPDDPMFTLSSSSEHGVFVAHALRADGFDASEDGTGRGTPIIAQSFNWQSGGDMRGIELRDTAALQRDQISAVCYDDYNQTLSDVAHTVVKGRDNRQPHAFNGAAVRRLTPRECERLQSFDDDYTLIIYRGKLAADGPRYKSLGNSMNVKVMRWILSRIERVDALASSFAAEAA